MFIHTYIRTANKQTANKKTANKQTANKQTANKQTAYVICPQSRYAKHAEAVCGILHEPLEPPLLIWVQFGIPS